MNKKILLAIMGLVVIAAIIAALFFFKKQKSNSVSESPATLTAPTAQQQDSNSVQQSSIKKLAQLGSSQECSVSDNTENTKTQGTVYIGNNNQVRADFSMTYAEITTNSHMILDNDMVYIWTDDQGQGYQTSLDAMETANAQFESSATASSKTLDLNKKVDYSCIHWNIDNSKFSKPTSIEFLDMSTLMNMQTNTQPNDAIQPGNNPKMAQCAACDSAPAEAREQCRQALSCP